MPTLRAQKGAKLNQLQRLLPEGLVVDAAWLETRGYSRGLRSRYLASGWLEQPEQERIDLGKGKRCSCAVARSIQHT